VIEYEDEIGEACSTHGKMTSVQNNFVRKHEIRRQIRRPSIGGRILLKLILKKGL
jgi:hypothetical protein